MRCSADHVLLCAGDPESSRALRMTYQSQSIVRRHRDPTSQASPIGRDPAHGAWTASTSTVWGSPSTCRRRPSWSSPSLAVSRCGSVAVDLSLWISRHPSVAVEESAPSHRLPPLLLLIAPIGLLPRSIPLSDSAGRIESLACALVLPARSDSAGWYGGAPLLKLVLPARSDSAGRAGGTERRREGSAFTWARAGRDDTGEGASERAGG